LWHLFSPLCTLADIKQGSLWKEVDTGGRDGAASVSCLKMSHRRWREFEKLRQAESQTSQLDFYEKHGSKRSWGGRAGI